MKIEWLRQQNRERVLIFCNGWGMDGAPLRPLAAEDMDVVVLSDHREDHRIPASLQVRLAGYGCRILVGWSMGVYFGHLYFSETPLRFTRAIAINGTLRPINDEEGIPAATFKATLEGFNAESRDKFYRRMCRPQGDFARLQKFRPQRPLDEQQSELHHLTALTRTFPAEEAIYTEVVVCKKDLVVPTANQLRFWDNHKVTRTGSCHFPFYRWSSWDEMLAAIHSETAAGGRG